MRSQRVPSRAVTDRRAGSTDTSRRLVARPVARRRLAALVASVVAVACGMAACAESAGDTRSCADERLADGTAYRHDPGLALAVTRGLAATNPDLAPIFEGAADFQAANPDHESVTLTDDTRGPEGAFHYVLVLANLDANPDLATPELLDTLTRVARRDGMLGVYVLVARRATSDEDERRRAAAGPALDELRELQSQQLAALDDAGIVPLPRADCPHDELSWAGAPSSSHRASRNELRSVGRAPIA